MKDGETSTKEGMKEIRELLAKELQVDLRHLDQGGQVRGDEAEGRRRDGW